MTPNEVGGFDVVVADSGGNTMASVFGHAYPGPGACITPAMTFGRLAADDMAGAP